jgi:hypothetical protein
MLAANLYGLFLGAIPALLLTLFFYFLWGWAPLASGLSIVFSLPALLLLLIAGTVAHELLHAVGWIVWGRKSWRVVRFGFAWRYLTPYAHCREPLPARAYRWGTVLPGLLLGVLPAIAALGSGSGVLAGLGFFFTLAAGGDFLILWLLRAVPAEAQVEDHPTRAGCIASC